MNASSPEIAERSARLRAELEPRDAVEAVLVDEIVSAAARLQRLHADPRALDPLGDPAWARAHELTLRAFFRAFEALNRRRRAAAPTATHPAPSTSPKAHPSPTPAAASPPPSAPARGESDRVTPARAAAIEPAAAAEIGPRPPLPSADRPRRPDPNLLLRERRRPDPRLHASPVV